MKSQRKQLLSLTVAGKVQNRVDQLLQKQYSAWRSNYVNQKIISSGQHKQYANQLLMEYIHYIYRQYGIKDPLQGVLSNEFNQEILDKNLKKSHFIKRLSFKDSPQKLDSLELSSSSIYQSWKTPQKKNINLKSSQVFYHNQLAETKKRSFKAYPQATPQTYHKTHRNLNLSHNMRLIKKSQPKRLQLTTRNPHNHRIIHEHRGSLPIYQHSSAQLNHSRFSRVVNFNTLNSSFTEIKPKQIQQSKVIFNSSNKIETSLQKPKKIKELYRYCLGCQDAIIQFNLQYHQKQCIPFQNLYRQNLEGILKHIQNKILVLKARIQQKALILDKKDGEDIQNYSKNLATEAEEIATHGQLTLKFQQNYDGVLKVGRKWVNVLQQINKIRWFIKVRNQIKQRFQM